MKPTHAPHQTHARHRKIGRKVLLADRLNRALNDTKKKPKYQWQFLPLQPKVIAALCLVVVVLGALGMTGARVYSERAAIQQEAAAAMQQKKLAAKGIAADTCRRKKLAEKADQIGKITYDQLYDYDECNK